MAGVYFTDLKEINKVRNLIKNDQPVLVEFCAEMTRYPLLIVPFTAVICVGTENQDKPSSRYYVSLMRSDGRSYTFELGYLHWTYVAEKLGINEADAQNVTVFLNALAHPDGIEEYLKTVPMQGNHVNHEKY